MRSRKSFSLSLALALVISLIVNPTHTASAEECSAKKCIEVSVDDESDEIVIIYRSPGSEKVEVQKREEPVVSGSFSAARDPKRTWIPYHPDRYAAWRESAKRAAATRKRNQQVRRIESAQVVQRASLTDRVSQLMPLGKIEFQPSEGATIHTPIIFWTTTPTSFEATLKVAGIPVSIELNPHFTWEYGEGSPFETSIPGAPYPLATNRFTYRTVGKRTIRLTTRWDGSFTVAGLTSPIDGVITQQSQREITVSSAPSRLLG